MNIIIVTHYFEEDGVMGSVRWTEFAYRLSENHNVLVVTHDNGNRLSENDSIKIIPIDNECFYVKRGKVRKFQSISNISNSKRATKTLESGFKDAIKTSLYFASMNVTAKKNVTTIIDECKKIGFSADAIITSSRPFINCYIGYYFAKKTGTKWYLDQRDLPFNDNVTLFTINKYKKQFSKFDQYVVKYFFVSNGLAESFFENCVANNNQCIKTKMNVLYNGYSCIDDIGENYERENEALVITYSGNLYSGKRDASMLFAAIKKLFSENQYNEKDIAIEYLGDSVSSMIEQAAYYGLTDLIEDRGRLPHRESIRIQKESDMLLLLTWNTKIDKGILTGKFYEYINARKPIICITSGDIPNGEAADLVNRLNLGIAIDYLNREQGTQDLYNYIKTQLNRKKIGEELLYSPNEAMTRYFDYDSLVKKLELLIET